MDNIKPIVELIMGQFDSQIEGELYRAVQRFGVNVDKERLLQALRDARQFWNEGYEAGRQGKPAWISVEERLPEVGGRFIGCGAKGGVFLGRQVLLTSAFAKVDGASSHRNYTHWMPLPEPPEVPHE